MIRPQIDPNVMPIVRNTNATSVTAVSYTHLDVYKRQPDVNVQVKQVAQAERVRTIQKKNPAKPADAVSPANPANPGPPNPTTPKP